MSVSLTVYLAELQLLFGEVFFDADYFPVLIEGKSKVLHDLHDIEEVVDL